MLYMSGKSVQDIFPQSDKEKDPLQDIEDYQKNVASDLNELQILIIVYGTKILFCFLLGLQMRYKEQEWIKKVFYKQDGVLAAVLSENQQHLISHFDLRRTISVGDITETPFKKWSHHLFVLSLINGWLLTSYISDDSIRNCFAVDIFAYKLIWL